MNKNLIRLLQQAYAIEIGAYHAYEGHWGSLPKDNLLDKVIIQKIQKDEWFHKQAVGFMLIELNAEPNRWLNALFWIIGKTISVSCYVIGYKAAMWGAGLMERLGSVCYYRIAREVKGLTNMRMYTALLDMAIQEEEHEEFFRECLK